MSIYDPCLLYETSSFSIIVILIDNILILNNNNYASKKYKIIKLVKIIIKDRKYLIYT